MKKITLLLILSLFLGIFCLDLEAQNAYFFPKAEKFNSSIPTPEQFLGYAIGTHHTRHDRVVAYLQELDRLSDRISSEIFGQTYEHRPQILLTITSPANHARLEDIRRAHLQRATQNMADNEPLVIHLGYGVHGNEPSSTEAAMLTAYYLAASESEETLNWLNNLVITLDPVINPDGRDRHTHWANMHKGTPMVADPLDREHNEVWPGGRTNHYWFDLNRDWFLGIHPETRNRMKMFHKWKPYVNTDHHEMGTNSSFYFDPGLPSSNNPIIPKNLYENLHIRFAKYFEKGMNEIGSMYFTKEVFDKLYPGYGSSYVNFYGGIGFLFEQASSRGHIQETTTIPLTFAFTIRNQVVASLATIRGSMAERAELIKHRRDFYRLALENARKSPIKGYIFGDSKDENRTNAFVNMLLSHEVECYEIESDQNIEGKRFEKGKAYIVPTEQLNYVMVQSIFEKTTTFADSIFYDASTWTLVHAFGLPHAELKAPFAKGKQVTEAKLKIPANVEKSNYAYLIDWTDYYAPKALYHLLNEGAIVQTAFKPFSTIVSGKERAFGYGTLVIPVQQQKISADSLFALLQKVSKTAMIDVFSVSTGYNLSGIDLGSNNIRTVKKPEALILVGAGINAYEVGEVWHLLDQRIGMPITKLELANLGRTNLNKYTTIVMVGSGFGGGGYNSIDESTRNRLKTWISGGGTLITLKGATEWAIKQGLTKEKLREEKKEEKKDDKDKKETKIVRIDFEKATTTEGAKGINGAIFEIDLDITHPIGFGYTNRKVSIYRNGVTILEPSTNPYSTVGQYTANPRISGYISKDNLKKLANSAAILVSSEGAGRIILFSDNPNFRGTWYGTNKLFLNALLLGGLISVPNVEGEEQKD